MIGITFNDTESIFKMNEMPVHADGIQFNLIVSTFNVNKSIFQMIGILFKTAGNPFDLSRRTFDVTGCTFNVDGNQFNINRKAFNVCGIANKITKTLNFIDFQIINPNNKHSVFTFWKRVKVGAGNKNHRIGESVK
ncbi:MAG: hypothetical protein M1480_01420 [Bacteroidetes bacterium]|nr:hypothetical protein [Bacteroidota bacterium]